MYKVIILTAILVIAMYAYSRRKIKQNQKPIDSIGDYHAARKRLESQRKLRSQQDSYRKYVTKYNSSEDYRERRGD